MGNLSVKTQTKYSYLIPEQGQAEQFNGVDDDTVDPYKYTFSLNPTGIQLIPLQMGKEVLQSKGIYDILTDSSVSNMFTLNIIITE